jgi:hypothetical protein
VAGVSLVPNLQDAQSITFSYTTTSTAIVTAIATTSEAPDMVLSSSRGKRLSIKRRF